jgi:uncharacterized protein
VTVEVRPLGVHCNIQCQYCYQEPQRDARNMARSYDIEAIKRAVELEGGPFSLFGGEPLLVPKADLEILWSFGLQRFQRNAIQSNGALIDDDHIRMFRQYRVQVGISIDGPGALNDVRWAGTLAKTRDATARTEAAIERLCRDGLNPSIIMTLHRNNGTPDKLPILLDWVRYLDTIGVRSMRLHLLEIDLPAIREKYALCDADNIAALRAFRSLERELKVIRLDLFSDMRNMLLGQDRNTTCVWNACDPYTTRAVRGIEGHGRRSNCGRTNKDGIDFIKTDEEGFERYLALYETPQRHGGCKDCRFFLMCKGQCPGTAIDGDWRNRTEHCAVWMALYDDIERELIDAGLRPLSCSAQRASIEHRMIELWKRGATGSISGIEAGTTASPDQPTGWRKAFRQLQQREQLHARGP